MIHLNALYDLCSKLYVDALVQPYRCMSENKALVDMVERSYISGNAIVIADRGYESYNNLVHIEKKGWNYLIRVKDINSNGIISALHLPDTDEFDVHVNIVLTKNKDDAKAHPHIYKLLHHKTKFDFLDPYTNSYPISFRVVRFKISEDSYETVLTNLEQSDFPPNELRKVFSKRWGIENSFRELKYAVGLTCFHAKKQEYIIQEVFARIIMYNFAEMITLHVVISQTDKKRLYQVNFTVAIHICRHFLRLLSNVPPPDVEALILKNILPVRPGRQNKRKNYQKKVVSFLYRVA